MRRRGFMSAALAMAWPARAARATGSQPARDCTIRDAATIESLKRGDKRLAGIVGAFEPPPAESAQLVVRLLRDDGTREELTRFALHPPKALASGAQPQRFLVPLAEHAARIEPGKALCIQVSLETANGAAVHGGMADIRTEVVSLPGAHR